MASVQPIRNAPSKPVAIDAHAMDNLRYIRETMERAGSFTAVPGWGGVAMGITALIASLIAAHVRLVDGSMNWWLAIWIAESMLAVSIGMLTMWRKAVRVDLKMWSGPARKFVFSFVPPLAVGASADDCAVARRGGERDSGRLADAVWHRSDHRRRVFRADRAGDGSVFSGAGSGVGRLGAAGSRVVDAMG